MLFQKKKQSSSQFYQLAAETTETGDCTVNLDYNYNDNNDNTDHCLEWIPHRIYGDVSSRPVQLEMLFLVDPQKNLQIVLKEFNLDKMLQRLLERKNRLFEA